MLNVMVWGFTNWISRDVIINLHKERIISLQKWLSWDTDTNKDPFYKMYCIDIRKLFRSDLQDEEIIYPSENIVNKVYESNYTILMHMSRDTEYYRLPVYEYFHIVNMYINVLYTMIKKNDINLVIFDDIPHGFGGVPSTLYYLAKALKINTLILSPLMIEDRFQYLYSMDDYGILNEVPEYVNQNIEKTKIEQKYEKELAYMSADVIKKQTGKDFSRFFKAFYNPKRWIEDRSNIIKDNLNKYDSLIDVFSRKLILSIGRKYARILYKTNCCKMMKKHVNFSEKYVYFPLHLQPEMTTDSLGRYYNDQILAIEKIRRMIPDDWYIYIKENPKQGYYMREKYFFRRISLLKKCILVDKSVDTYKLMRGAQFVSTITGTAAWEAITGGKCAVIFGRAWYNSMPGIFVYNDSLSHEDIISYRINHNDIENELNKLKRKSAVGLYRDDVYKYSKNKGFDLRENNIQMIKFFKFIISDIENKNGGKDIE